MINQIDSIISAKRFMLELIESKSEIRVLLFKRGAPEGIPLEPVGDTREVDYGGNDCNAEDQGLRIKN